MNKKNSQFRKMLASREIIVAPGVYSALPAMIAENAGFQAVYMSGYTTAAVLLGVPDIGLITMAEMAENAGRINDAVSVPVVADCDNGYGNALNVMRSVRAYEKAGVSAIQLEDQIFPKKCGHMAGKEVISAEEMVGKIHAARDAREDPDLVIIARTDARTVVGFDEAVRRSNMYAEAGADIVFLESPTSEDEMRQIPRLVNAPVMANMVEAGKSPLFTNQQLEEMGYSLVIWPGSSAWSTAKAVSKTMHELRERGTTEGLVQDEMISWEGFNTLMKVPEYLETSKKYQR
ncbi:isocitrate lyase/phosphoenolpyruvate mutase family protein [Desulfovermiculus halophilus]|uniref:isocitrate lyase/phosphoenolpyruvate mutase family protein n=1 Tax=Desulfovermiculus halophilus TaxID=339722 RepID=UPI000480D9FE